MAPVSANSDDSPAQIDADAIRVPEQPASSQIQYEETANGLAVCILPVGLRKGSKGQCVSSIFFFIFSIIILIAAILGENDIWYVPLIILVSFAASVGSMLGAINMGRRSAELVLMGDELVVKRRSIFGVKVRSFTLSEIGRIRFRPSGMVNNNRPVMELQVENPDGKKLLGCLSQINDMELRWLSALLTHKLLQLKS